MGILSLLLTGGSILGKVCQNIKEVIPTNLEIENGRTCSVKASKSEINGVRFTEVAEDNKTELCAFNADVDTYACVAYPNGYGKTGGNQIFIPPAKTAVIATDDIKTVSPEIPFYVQRLNFQEDSEMDNNRVIISFKNLTLDGKEQQLSDTKLSATPSQLKVVFPNGGLGDLASAEFSSDNGIRAILQDAIPYTEAGEAATQYSIPFDVLGFTADDVLSGLLKFKVTTSTVEKIKETAAKNSDESKLKTVSEYMKKVCGISGVN